jgi:hypothetical protein
LPWRFLSLRLQHSFCRPRWHLPEVCKESDR